MRLEAFRAAKEPEIQALRQLEYIGLLPLPRRAVRPSFLGRLAKPAALPHVVAEFKRASPSRGDILLDLAPEEAARQYAAGGAACLSVLTEEAHFKGKIGYLGRMAGAGLPLLRKDFVLDPLQVLATAATPASALLLIVRLTPEVALLRRLRELAESLGMDAVVEVFDAEDLALARESGARLIQVNARNLDTLKVDRAACLRLAERYAPRTDEVWIAASGMSRPEHLRQAGDAGYRAALVGTSLMEGGAPGTALAALVAGKRARREEQACPF